MLPSKTFWVVIPLAILLFPACQPAADHNHGKKEPNSLRKAALQLNSFDPLDDVIGLNERWIGELEGMVARRRIRALVPYSPTSYYIDGTERSGIAYEAMVYFEEELNRKLGNNQKVNIVFIPLTRDQLIPALLEGYGDIVVAGLTITPERQKLVDFSLPVLTGAREVLATGPATASIRGFGSLPGQTVYVRQSSSFYEHLHAINDSLQQAGKPEIGVAFVEEQLEDEDILEMVNSGLFPMAIIDEHKGRFWAQVFGRLTIHEDVVIHEGGEIAWAIRKDSPKFKAVVDEFVARNRKGKLLGNMIFNRYLTQADYIKNNFSQEDRKRFRTTRSLFMKYGKLYGLDWLLLAAQGFQESRLNPELVSPVGAVGIMQVKPSTAKDPNIGIQDVYSLEGNIEAGAKYLRFLIDQYFISPDIDSLNAGLLGVAAYNAGPNRIRKLQKKAEDKGLDPTVWFDNVEIAAAGEIGHETVEYVSNIYKYYSSYRSLARYMAQTGKNPFEGW